jgi:NitT/TauT family transport system ATP-binding protein
MDLFELDEETEEELGRLLGLVKAGELLDLVDSRGEQVWVTAAGLALLDHDTSARKILLAEQLQRLNVVQWVLSSVRDAGRGGLDRTDLEISIARQQPRAVAALDTLIGWARYAELLDYQAADRLLTLGEAAQER